MKYFDAHCDTIWYCSDKENCSDFRSSHGHVDLCRASAFSGYAQVFALFQDTKKLTADPWNECCRLHDYFLSQMKRYSEYAEHCQTGQQIDAAVSRGKAACILSVEGADLMNCEIGKIPVVKNWGVRFINPVWNHKNAISGTNCEDSSSGLSDYGKDFVRELEKHHILVDVSHLSDPGFYDVASLVSSPICATHSNSRSLCGHPRNLTDSMFDIIRDSGGIVGMNYYLSFVGTGENTIVDHIEHFLSRNGEKTLCFGGDLDGCDRLCSPLTGLQDVGSLYTLLKGRGYSDSLLEDLFWNNLRRVLN